MRTPRYSRNRAKKYALRLELAQAEGKGAKKYKKFSLDALYWAFPEIRTDVEDELPELKKTQREYGNLDRRLHALGIKKGDSGLEEGEAEEMNKLERRIKDYLHITIPMPVPYGAHALRRVDRLLAKYGGDSKSTKVEDFGDGI